MTYNIRGLFVIVLGFLFWSSVLTAGSSLPLASEDKRDLDRLRRRTIGPTRAVLILAAIVLSITLVARLMGVVVSLGIDPRTVIVEQNLSNNSLALDFYADYERYQGWLVNHGISVEKIAFKTWASFLLQTLVSIDSNYTTSGIMQSLTISLHFALLRIGFIVVACARVWIALVLCGTIYAMWRQKLHLGRDLLGETGTGRIYYSGIRVDLESANSNGLPEKQITGLACPLASSDVSARASDLGQLLIKFGVLNATNLRLTAIIVAHGNFPAYIPKVEEESNFNKSYEGSTLAENAFLVIEKALSLHALYADGILDVEEASFSSLVDRSEHRLSKHEYSHLLQAALNRVLTLKMKESLGSLDASLVATALLACEASKAMTYKYESQRWFRRSNFGQLNARATVHSIPAFSDDYNYEARSNIRRALVYAARSSFFGPVHFPLDLSLPTKALRQWTEILFACPHELAMVSDEVELYGLVAELESAWKKMFVEQIRSGVHSDIYTDSTQLVLIPLPRLLSILEPALSPGRMERMSELVRLLSQRQRLKALASSFSEDAERSVLSSHEKIYPPFSIIELRQLASDQDLTEEALKIWSSLRVVFNSQGWLARRVGDKSIAEDSIIYAALYQVDGGVLAKPGVVALRASKLDQSIGRNWHGSLQHVQRAVMVANKHEFDLLIASGGDKSKSTEAISA